MVETDRHSDNHTPQDDVLSQSDEMPAARRQLIVE
jgi:hypothetical protein